MTFHVFSLVLLFDIARLWLTCAIGLGEAAVPIVRRAGNDHPQSNYRRHAEIDVHGHLTAEKPHRMESGVQQGNEVDVDLILSKADLLANDPSMQVHLPSKDRERLGIHPDMELPRRDSLLQARAAALRLKQAHDSTGSKEASSMPFSLLQESSVQRHEGGVDFQDSSPPNTHELRDAPSPSRFELPVPNKPTTGYEVPDWVPKNAFAEDGSLILERAFFSASYKKHKKPEWTLAGTSHQDSSAAAFESEMARLGREDEVEDSLLAMEQDSDLPADPQVPKSAYRFYKFTPVKLRAITHADMVQIAEFRFFTYGYELPLHQASLAWNEMGANPEGHGAMMVRDKNWQTVWQDRHMGSIMLAFGAPFTLTNFMFITSMDNPQDDPVQWYLEGTNNPIKGPWTMLHAQLSDGNVPPQRTASTEMFSWKVDCALSDWHEWSECSETCSGGNRTRIRKILLHSWNNGHCDHVFDQLGYCNEQPCETLVMKAATPRGASLAGLKSLLIAASYMLASMLVNL